VVPNPDFDFFGSMGDPGARELWLASSVSPLINAKNVSGKVNSRLDPDSAAHPAHVRTIFWVNHVHYRCLSRGKSILAGVFLMCIGFATLDPIHSSRHFQDPSGPQKIKILTRDHSANTPESSYTQTSTAWS